MINADRNQAVEMISDALPELRVEANRLREQWLPETPPFTVLMGALGRVLGATVGRLSDDAVERIANLIEALLSTGTEDVKNGVATGLLESLLASSDQDASVIRLMTRLGPNSKKYCREWDAFTGQNTPGL